MKAWLILGAFFLAALAAGLVFVYRQTSPVEPASAPRAARAPDPAPIDAAPPPAAAPPAPAPAPAPQPAMPPAASAPTSMEKAPGETDEEYALRRERGLNPPPESAAAHPKKPDPRKRRISGAQEAADYPEPR
jgi:hypothetical protein